MLWPGGDAGGGEHLNTVCMLGQHMAADCWTTTCTPEEHRTIEPEESILGSSALHVPITVCLTLSVCVFVRVFVQLSGNTKHKQGQFSSARIMDSQLIGLGLAR